MTQTPLHVLTIDLSKLSKFELLNLAQQFSCIADAANIYKELTEELTTVSSQIVAYTELTNK